MILSLKNEIGQVMVLDCVAIVNTNKNFGASTTLVVLE
jgi:hypothetical protein